MDIKQIIKKIGLLHSVSSETATSPELIDEILDRQKANWADPNLKILDPCCGRGTFLLKILERLEAHGHSRQHAIQNMIYGCDSNKIQSMIADKSLTMALAVKNNIYNEDSLTKDWGMKFDIVVGNAPFRDTSNKAERWSLWIPFVIKSWNELIKPDGQVAMITPVSWMAPGEDINRIIFNNASVINLDAGKYFNVGSTFSYYVLDKKTNTTSVDVISEGTITNIPRTTSYLPKKVNSVALSINKKTVFNSKPKFKFQRTTQHHTSKKEIFGQGNYDVFHTHAQTLKSINKMAEHDKHKVMFTLSGYSTALIDDDISCSQAVAWITINANEITGADNYFNGKLVQYLIQANKWSGWNNLEVIKSIPKIDLTVSKTDQEIYKLFNLTQEEIDYIEATVK